MSRTSGGVSPVGTATLSGELLRIAQMLACGSTVWRCDDIDSAMQSYSSAIRVY